MISIAEDQSLPLDIDGTLNPAGSSMAFDNTLTGDATFSAQGVMPSLNNSGRVSPHHRRTMKDQETQLQELKKENFGLKLRIYHMQEALQKQWGDDNQGWKMNVDLQVQMDELREEVKEKEQLLVRAKAAIDTMTHQHDDHVTAMQNALDKAGDTDTLRQVLEDRDSTITSLRQQLEEAEDRLNELEGAKENEAEQNLAAQRELSKKANELDALQRKCNDLHSNCGGKEKEIAGLRAELANTAGQLAASNAEVGKLKLENEQMARVVAEGKNEVATLQVQLANSDRGNEQLLLLQKDLANRDHKIQILDKALEAKEAELAGVQKVLAAREQSLAGAAREADARQHQHDEDVAKLNHALKQLQDVQQQAQQAINEKDQMIKRLQEELAEAKAKLNEADGRLLQLSTNQTAELGVLRNKAEELEQALDQKEKQLKALREELDRIKNARDGAVKDLEKTRLKALDTEYQMKQLENELKNKGEQLTRTEYDLEQARLAMNQQRETQYTTQEAEAELLKLKSLNEDLQRSLTTKEGEIAGLKEAMHLKEQVTKELIARQQQLLNQKAEVEAMKNDANRENQRLMHELQQLRQQLVKSSEAIQQLKDHVSSLEQARQQLIDQLRMKDEELSELIKKLQELQQIPQHETSPSPNSVKHFLQSIVQGLHSVQTEIAAGRHDSSQASSSIKSQLSQLAELQRQLAELSPGRDATPKLSIYTVAPGDSVITPAESVASSDDDDHVDDDHVDDDDDDDDIPPLAAGESLLSLTSPNTKAKVKIAGLEAELEEVKLLNESLQSQLKEYDHKFEQQKQDHESTHEGLATQVYELQAQLQVSEAKLQEHLANDAVNEEEVEGLRRQVDNLSQQCKILQAQLQKANAEIQRLKGLQTTPPKISSSPKRTLHTTSDTKLQFSSPTKSPISGSVKALQEKYHESIRLNQELQEKLHAQLNTTPPRYIPDSFTPSPGTSPRKQAAEIAHLKETVSTLQGQLDKAKQEGNNLRQQVIELQQSSDMKQQETDRLHHDLADAKKKISALEDQLGKILKDKNRALEELTRKNSLLAEQLSASLAENEQLKLQQSTEDEELREQLDNALTELGELRKQNSSLQSQLRLLAQQLAQKEQQIASLQTELSIYQQLLGDQRSSSPLSRGKGQTGNILKLLEEVRALRDQLGAGIQSNADLSNELRKKLEESGVNLNLSGLNQNGSYHPVISVPHDSMGSHDTTGSQATVISVGSHRPAHSRNTTLILSDSGVTVPSVAKISTQASSRSQPFASSPTGEDETDFVEPVFDHQVGSRSRPVETRPRKRTTDSSISCASPGVDKMIQTISEAEGRLKQALESSGIQGIDRSFLEELLRYLEQQRRELDEGRQLLGMLDGDSTGVPFRLDLSKIYEQLLQAKALAGESKSILQKKHFHTQKPRKL